MRTSVLNCLLLIFYALLPAEILAAEMEIVLVASEHSTLSKLTPLESRKVFLGIPVNTEESQVTPIINVSDDKLKKSFLQYTVFMTEASYKRQLLKRAVKFGSVLPDKLQSEKEIVKKLHDDPSKISFIWKSALKDYPGLKVIPIY